MRLIDADALFQSYLDTDKQADLIKYEEDKLKAGGNGDFFPGFYTAVMIFRDLINEAPTIGGWISVKERLPEKDEDVLVYSGSDIAAAVYYKYKFNKRTGFDKTAAGGFYDDELELIDGVTHWMPLPEPPEVEK